MYVHVCVHMCTFVCACMCMCVPVPVCMHVHVCVHMHTWGEGSAFTSVHSDRCKSQELTGFSCFPCRIKLSTEKLFLVLVYCLKQIL